MLNAEYLLSINDFFYSEHLQGGPVLPIFFSKTEQNEQIYNNCKFIHFSFFDGVKKSSRKCRPLIVMSPILYKSSTDIVF